MPIIGCVHVSGEAGVKGDFSLYGCALSAYARMKIRQYVVVSTLGENRTGIWSVSLPSTRTCERFLSRIENSLLGIFGAVDVEGLAERGSIASGRSAKEEETEDEADDATAPCRCGENDAVEMRLGVEEAEDRESEDLNCECNEVEEEDDEMGVCATKPVGVEVNDEGVLEGSEEEGDVDEENDVVDFGAVPVDEM